MTSTKEKIKKEALSLFSQKGYEATSMRDIAVAVGIRKSSLYTHYSSKEEIFLDVYEEMAVIYENLNSRLFKEAENLPFEEKIFLIFKGFILFYYQNKDFQAFWNQMTVLAPPSIRATLLPDLTKRDMVFHEKMVEIFQEGIDKGYVKKGDPQRKVISFRAMRDGVVAWMLIVPELKEEWIVSFWSDLWNGLQN